MAHRIATWLSDVPRKHDPGSSRRRPGSLLQGGTGDERQLRTADARHLHRVRVGSDRVRALAWMNGRQKLFTSPQHTKEFIDRPTFPDG
jgi:hypothetical protein